MLACLLPGLLSYSPEPHRLLEFARGPPEPEWTFTLEELSADYESFAAAVRLMNPYYGWPLEEDFLASAVWPLAPFESLASLVAALRSVIDEASNVRRQPKHSSYQVIFKTWWVLMVGNQFLSGMCSPMCRTCSGLSSPSQSRCILIRLILGQLCPFASVPVPARELTACGVQEKQTEFLRAYPRLAGKRAASKTCSLWKFSEGYISPPARRCWRS